MKDKGLSNLQRDVKRETISFNTVHVFFKLLSIQFCHAIYQGNCLYKVLKPD